MTLPVYMGVGKGGQTIFLAAERNKDWTVKRLLLEGGLEPVYGNGNPCSYGCAGSGPERNPFFLRA